MLRSRRSAIPTPASGIYRAGRRSPREARRSRPVSCPASRLASRGCFSSDTTHASPRARSPRVAEPDVGCSAPISTRYTGRDRAPGPTPHRDEEHGDRDDHRTTTPQGDARERRDPLRRRLRRRHADHRQPVHQHDGARSATTSRPSPTSRPRSAPPRARCRASSGFQVHFASNDIFTPGDAVDVLVAMNPAALKMNLADLQDGRHPHRQHRQLQGDRPQEGADGGEPARGRLARRATACSRSSSPSSRARRSRSSGSTPRAWTAARTSSRSACATGSTTGRWTPTLPLARREVRQQARARRGQQARA